MSSAIWVAPVHLYELLWKTPVMNGMLRSPHGLEVSLVFNNPDAPTTAPVSGGGARALAMAAVMSDAWTSFARTGDPSTPSLPWPAYDLERLDAIVEGDKAAVRWKLTVSYHGGEPVTTEACDIWTLDADGKMASLLQFVDTSLVAKLAGADTAKRV